MPKRIRIAEIEDLLTSMKADLEKRGLRTFDIIGGMKEKGYSDHDVDLDIMLSQEPSTEILRQIMDKWDNELRKKHGISLDVNIHVENCELAHKYANHELRMMVKDDYEYWEILGE